jgi:hypothetical protein
MKSLVAVAMCPAIVGCSGGSPDASDAAGPGDASGSVGASSALSRTLTVNSLTSGTLCDWQSAGQGGHARSVDCSDGSTQTTDPHKATCVSSVTLVGRFCPTLTVADMEDCAKATQTNLCTFDTQAACGNVRDCLGP